MPLWSGNIPPPTPPTYEEEFMDEKLQRHLINCWCKLDNAFGACDKLAHSAELDDSAITDLARVEAERMMTLIDKARHSIMQKFGYDDYDEFVDYLQDNEKASWNKVLGNWEVPYEIYL